jgi:hypothetical protein
MIHVAGIDMRWFATKKSIHNSVISALKTERRLEKGRFGFPDNRKTPFEIDAESRSALISGTLRNLKGDPFLYTMQKVQRL